MVSIERKTYLQQLMQWRDKHVIKVITGIRRCGKSTLMMQFQQLLREEKVNEKQIISVNLEDLAFENLKDYRELYHRTNCVWQDELHFFGRNSVG